MTTEYNCFNLETIRQNRVVTSSFALSSMVRDKREAKNVSALNSLVSKCPNNNENDERIDSDTSQIIITYDGIRLHLKLCSHQSAYLYSE